MFFSFLLIKRCNIVASICPFNQFPVQFAVGLGTDAHTRDLQVARARVERYHVPVIVSEYTPPITHTRNPTDSFESPSLPYSIRGPCETYWRRSPSISWRFSLLWKSCVEKTLGTKKRRGRGSLMRANMLSPTFDVWNFPMRTHRRDINCRVVAGAASEIFNLFSCNRRRRSRSRYWMCLL